MEVDAAELLLEHEGAVKVDAAFGDVGWAGMPSLGGTLPRVLRPNQTVVCLIMTGLTELKL